MHDPQLKPTPSPSRSLPPLRPDTDRGRPKNRLPTDPDSYARSLKGAVSVSLPPIRPAVRGSRDEECGPLPGISSIIRQADANKHFDPPVPRRLSESSQRVFFNSLGKDQNETIRTGSGSQNHSMTTIQARAQDSTSTDGSISRPSSPEPPSALSSSFSTIASASSLSSILEDRSACGSPRPILPGFAQLDSTLPSNTLPPIGAHGSPRSSVFELSDLRTHLPLDDLTPRPSKLSSRTRAVLASPKSTPLPLSRPLSPAVPPGSSSFNGGTITQRLSLKAILAPTERELGQAPPNKEAPPTGKMPVNKKSFDQNASSNKGADVVSGRGDNPSKTDKPHTGAGSPILSPIKVEFETIMRPRSPASKGSKDAADFFGHPKDKTLYRTPNGSITDRPSDLHIDTFSGHDQDDNMSCTPTQTISRGSQLTPRSQSPLSAIESSPVTSTETAPHTPVMRHYTPPIEPSTFTPTASSSSTSESDIRSPNPTVTSDTEDEDVKPLIVKQHDSEATSAVEAVGGGARHRERQARRRGNAASVDESSVQTRGFFGHPSGFGSTFPFYTQPMDPMQMPMQMPMQIPMQMQMQMQSLAAPLELNPLSQLEQQARRYGLTLRPADQEWSSLSPMPMPMPMPGQTPQMIQQQQQQQVLHQQIMQRQQMLMQMRQEQEQAIKVATEMSNVANWGQHDLSGPTYEPMPDQMSQNFTNIMQPMQPMQPMPQDDLSFMLPPSVQEDPNLSLGPSPGSTLYSGDEFASFSSDDNLFPKFVPPVTMNPPMENVLVAPLSNPMQQPPMAQPIPLPPPGLNKVNFRASSSEEPVGKDDAGGSSSGAGTHKCEACGKKFRRPSGLKDHMNIHSGDKPYCCPLETCRKGFATRSNMIRHHNKTHPSRAKIGGVADIAGDVDDADSVGDDSGGSPGGGGRGGASSQSRFRVVQQSKGSVDAVGGGGGVGPARGNKERKLNRRGHGTTQVA